MFRAGALVDRALRFYANYGSQPKAWKIKARPNRIKSAVMRYDLNINQTIAEKQPAIP